MTIESYQIGEDGNVTLYNSNTATATIDPVFAETAADVIAIADALLLNLLDLDADGGVFAFGLDADGNGAAESTIVVSTDATEVNIVQLVGIAPGAGFGTAADGDLNIA